MTSYPPQPPVRKLTRSRSNKMLGGVCAGIASYLNMDVTLVRILTVVLSLFTGIPIIAYIVCLIVVPEEDPPPYVGPQTVHVPEAATYPSPPPAPSAPNAGPTTPPFGQSAPADPVWGPDGAPWDRSGADPASATTADPTPTADPGPAPADPEVPNEAAAVADSEPPPESAPPEPAPGQESTWESAPADAEHTDPVGTSEHPSAGDDDQSAGKPDKPSV